MSLIDLEELLESLYFEEIRAPVLSGAVLALLGWAAVLLGSQVRNWRDRQKVYRWLLSNTRDEPGGSHVDTATLAKGTALTEERVRYACYVRSTHLSFFYEVGRVEHLA